MFRIKTCVCSSVHSPALLFHCMQLELCRTAAPVTSAGGYWRPVQVIAVPSSTQVDKLDITHSSPPVAVDDCSSYLAIGICLPNKWSQGNCEEPFIMGGSSSTYWCLQCV